MPLNDLTSEYSINTISQKTNISVEALEKLLNKDWDSLQRAKVDGFLRIIERDFNVDLSDIKQEAKEFYATHKRESPNRPIDLVDAESVGGGTGKVFANILTILAIALVAYAIWFYFFSFNQKDNNSTSSSNVGLFNDSINSAKSLIGVVEHNTTPKKQEKKNKKIVVDVNSSNTLSSVKKSSKTQESIEKNRTTNKFNIISSNEENKTKLNDNSSVVSNNIEEKKRETNIVSSSAIESSSNNTTKIKESVESLLEENRTSLSNSSNKNNSTIAESNLSSELNNTVVTKDTNNTLETDLNKIGEFTIKNRAKSIWLGIYNLDTKKRVVKVLAKTPYKYKLDGKRVAIVTGHNKFTIETDNGINKSFSKRGRVYLLITEDEIKIITKKEYKKVTKNRAW